MEGESSSSFVENWKRLDGQFDEYARLRELRSLVAQGAISQALYDQMHRYVLEKNLSKKKKGGKKKSTREAPELPPRKSSIFSRGKSGTLPKGSRIIEKGGETLVEGDERATLWGRKAVMEGFLYKRATKSGRNWRRRYVKIYFDRMDYFSKKTDKTPRGTIHLTKDFFVADSILRRIKNTRPHGFMVSDFATTFYLAASSPEAKVYWMHTIQRVLQKLKDQDEQTDEPVRLGEPERTPSMRERDMQARLDAYRRGLPVTEVARHVSKASSKGRSSKVSTFKAASLGAPQSRVEVDDDEEEDLVEDEDISDLDDDSAVEEEDEEEEVHDDDDNDDEASGTTSGAPVVSYMAPLRVSGGSSKGPDGMPVPRIMSGKSAVSHTKRRTLLSVEHETRTRSIADAALSAHESARRSAQVHLGLDVMSYDQQEDLRDEAATAQATRLMADMENEAAMSEMDSMLSAKDALKEELRAAREAGDEARVRSIEEEYEETRAKMQELEEVMARSAAERAEAEEIAERNREQIARANAANAIVLELAKVDEAILLAEQLAEKADEARKRAEAAAAKVHEEALAESREQEAKLREAEEAARKAQEEEEERARQEMLIAQKLEETARKKVNEKQRRKIEEVAESAAKARSEAEERRFEAELAATELANQKLDSLAKAAAVERALNETKAMINKSRTRQGLDEFGFARPREERESGRASASAEPPRRKRSSIFDKLRSRRSKSRASATSSRAPAGAAPPASPTSTGDPAEASNSFRSFFSSFTQAAVDGIEYVTGLQLAGDEAAAANGEQGLEDDDADSFYDEEDDYDAASDDGDMFDKQLRAVGEEERLQAASAWIEFETNRLLEIIKDIGYEDEYGRSVATFKDLLDVYEDISDTLVGILIRAKRAGKVYYEGDMLFEIEHDDVEITALE
ncbi:Actin-binding Rho-activating protein [Hondaea fermentalgiana]|uniref:Actin-binding Rho-activating protein n=1 Tax=Hondaea fermentalgiana TaxID=2315210 RepID=A0A2R5GX65_9STRA|nr:Actin-binding Rho-activating protein [Hondaea fermentalgiana]|eukprot:GBG34919.1 Actin-binding Rho-activating protein [Hondaea fermentalgiana]